MAFRDRLRKTVSREARPRILQRDGYVCGYCPERKRRKPSSLVIDHIIPVKDGGAHEPANFVASCRSCNRKKWIYHPNQDGAPRLRWFARKAVAKVTTKGKKYAMRTPVISFRKM